MRRYTRYILYHYVLLQEVLISWTQRLAIFYTADQFPTCCRGVWCFSKSNFSLKYLGMWNNFRYISRQRDYFLGAIWSIFLTSVFVYTSGWNQQKFNKLLRSRYKPCVSKFIPWCRSIFRRFISPKGFHSFFKALDGMMIDPKSHYSGMFFFFFFFFFYPKFHLSEKKNLKQKIRILFQLNFFKKTFSE